MHTLSSLRRFAVMLLVYASCSRTDAPLTEAPLTEARLEVGSHCQHHQQCASGLCDSVTPGAKTCQLPCDAGCSQRHVCASLEGGPFGCVPEREGLCEPCSSDSDCGYPGDRCLVLREGKFCGRDCSFDGKCPADYLCRPGVTLDGGAAASQCQPASGSCTCGPKTAGQTKPCEVKSPHGRSMGTKTCDGAHGWGSCNAKTPRRETCNGEDDDCDGQVDEGLGEDRCGVGECARVTAVCLNGEPQRCVPGTPAAEQCDQKDNDCDGTVDEGFDLKSDLHHCGACGISCSFPNAVARCAAGRCEIDRCDPGFCDHDQQPANGCERGCTVTNGGVEKCDGVDNDCDGTVDEGFNLKTDPHHCGACGNSCSLPNAVAGCFAGRCEIDRCDPGFCDHDKQPGNGCEHGCTVTNGGVEICDGVDNDCDGTVDEGFPVASDPNNCGACGTQCSAPNAATYSCTAGRCGVLTCAPGRADCNGVFADGCEVDTTSSASDCGACGVACASPNATAVCSMGVCGIQGCTAGFADCDGLPVTGCEVDTGSDLANCGACGNACRAAGATPSCTAGACGYACLPGFVDLDGSSTNGCEYACTATGAESCDGLDNDCDGSTDEGFDLTSDPSHCGSCANACTAPQAASYTCSMSTCGLASCSPGFADCDRLYADGCEVDTDTSPANCGACGNVCVLVNATPVCRAGQCAVGSCSTGFSDCDGVAATGCETDTTSDLANCGACGTVCSFANAVPSCTAGACAYSCLPGFVDLDGGGANGCEYACTATGAEVCDGRDNDCDGSTDEGFDLANDTTHCGACGNVCVLSNATPVCRAGQCAVGSCSTGFSDCDGAAATGCETDTTSDLANCGACGTVCSFANAAPSCTTGSCQYACLPGFVDLDGSGANGCEYACVATGAEVCDGRDNDCDGSTDEGFNLASDTSNCGACGNACAAPRVATQVCNMGTCAVGACSAGFTNCNGLYADGCETDTGNSVTSCGGCGVVCSTPNATPRCMAGSCRIQNCSTGFRDCNAAVGDGCEVNTSTDRNNCGVCGRACSATTSCINGQCR